MEPERKDQQPQPQVPEGVKQVEEEMLEPSEALVEMGVQKVPSQFPPQAQVTGDSGQPLIQTPATQSVTITIPATPQQLDDWSKGAPEDSITWFASFWLRLIKKAIHFGWRIIMKKGVQNATSAV